MAYLIGTKKAHSTDMQDLIWRRRAIVYTEADRDLVVAALKKADPGVLVQVVRSVKHRIND